MNLLEAHKQMRRLIKSDQAVLLTGPSGLGKTSIAFQEASRFKEECRQHGLTCGVGQIFAAHYTPSDILGVQFKGERTYGLTDLNGEPVTDEKTGEQKRVTMTVTDPAVPMWMMSMPFGDDPGGRPLFLYDRAFLIIDEYGQGEPDTKRALAEVFLHGAAPPWRLPEGSVRIACTNVGARYGVSKDFDFAIARRVPLSIEGDIDVTLKYMDKPYRLNNKVWQTTPVVKAWAKAQPHIVFEKEPEKQGPWCMPRTLCAADRYIQVVEDEEKSTDYVNDPHFAETMSGIIGLPATQSLTQHLQFRLELPSYEDVVKDPETVPLPTRADLVMLMTYQLAGWAKPEDMPAVVKYVQRLPKDMAVAFIASLLRRDYRAFYTLPAVQGWINKNAALIAVITSLANG